MKWIKYKIETKNEATDIVASVLYDNGICGAEIEDTLNLSKEDIDKMYIDIPIEKVNTGKAQVSFYVSISDKKVIKNNSAVIDAKVDSSYNMSNDNIFTKDEFDNILTNIKNELLEYKDLMDLGSLNIETEELDDEVFLNKWKENFKRIDIGNVSIIPNFDKNPIDENRTNIYIEPGSAFGTGQHSTTSLCVKIISDIINNKQIEFKNSSLLDVGCGSGILAIVGKKLGIEKVHAQDIDKTIEENLTTNLKLNNLLSDIEYSFGNLIDNDDYRKKLSEENCDIVAANILAPVIISLIKDVKISTFIKPNGYFVCSGIIDEKENDVRNALIESGDFSDVNVYKENNWVAFMAKRSK